MDPLQAKQMRVTFPQEAAALACRLLARKGELVDARQRIAAEESKIDQQLIELSIKMHRVAQESAAEIAEGAPNAPARVVPAGEAGNGSNEQ